MMSIRYVLRILAYLPIAPSDVGISKSLSLKCILETGVTKTYDHISQEAHERCTTKDLLLSLQQKLQPAFPPQKLPQSHTL